MNAIWPIVITAIAVAVAVAALLLVRRRAPDGGFFTNGDRAAGMFGVLASGFAILLGFVVFLSFESFDSSRTGAETEAIVVAQQFETAQFLPAAVSGQLSVELICYGRSVVGQEWPEMERGRSALVNPWGIELFRTLKTADPQTPVEQAAFGTWFDQTSERQTARSARIHGAEGVMPRGVWIVLFFMAAVILVFMMFFADSGEPRVVQAIQIGSVVAVITASMFVISYLSNPFREGQGGLKPVSMERTLATIESNLALVPGAASPPCDEQGKALATT